jgi:hypothetical protein
MSEQPVDNVARPASQDAVRLMGEVPKLAGLVSLGALAISVVHEWGYFQVIGLQYLTIASPLDYLSSTLYWLPVAVALAACVLAQRARDLQKRK